MIYAILSLFMAPCLVEDDINCYWDADVFGNGVGDSFISVVVPIGFDSKTEYIFYENGDIITFD